jgi:ribosomal-protein-alanine N-acetyltransferase
LKPRIHLEQPSARREREFLAAALRETQESFFVIDNASAALAGVVNINDIVRHSEQSGRLGYYAFAPLVGTGLMRAGLQLVVYAAFRDLGLHRLEANIQRSNVRSIALVEGLGFKREGTARGFLKIGNRWRDHERWALLKDEWRR